MRDIDKFANIDPVFRRPAEGGMEEGAGRNRKKKNTAFAGASEHA